MKILHTSDWHLGKMLYGRSLLEDQAYFVERQFFPILEKERPDCVVLAGDVFDRQIAPVEAIRLFDRVIEHVSQTFGIPLLAAAGNHDGPDRMAVGARLLRRANVYIAGRPEQAGEPVVLRDREGEVRFYLVPYLEPASFRERQAEIRTCQDAYRYWLEQIGPIGKPGVRNVMVGHLFAAGAVSSASETVYLGGAGQVAASLFDPFDYVALGHLHRAQRAGENGWYSGSPLPYSFDEGSGEKSMRLVTLTNSGVEVRPIPVAPLRGMRILRGDFETLLQAGQNEPVTDYLSIELTNALPVFEPMARLREVYPNLLCLRGGWMAQPAVEQEDRRKLREDLLDRKAGDAAVFEAFLRQVCGEEPEEEDRHIFQAACAKADREEAGT